MDIELKSKIYHLNIAFNYNITNTVNRTDLLYDIIITFSKRNIGSSQCILVLNNAKDTQYIIKQGVMSFRGFPLQFTQWKQ